MLDMLDSILLQRPGSGVGGSVLRGLQSRCSALIALMHTQPEAVPHSTVVAVDTALRAYVPSAGGTEATLVNALAHVLPPGGLESPVTPTGKMGDSRPPVRAFDRSGGHSSGTRSLCSTLRVGDLPVGNAPSCDGMRVVELHHAIRPERWNLAGTQLGRLVPVLELDQADYFVSHAHVDGVHRKAQMLLEYLCLHAF